MANAIVENLKSFVSTSSDVSNQLMISSGNFTQISEQSTKAAEEITKTMQYFSEASVEQARMAETGSNKMNELSLSLDNVYQTKDKFQNISHNLDSVKTSMTHFINESEVVEKVKDEFVTIIQHLMLHTQKIFQLLLKSN
ncbi:hypothetical protein [Clostridium sp. C2-6-12]|uniref:hypothetical protein n=1 Tax=Clostridium sp. C2-6-12 TaxID=2698832 RepID=UPI0013687C09|nr:hypothetical protein [Clostridium sp. C2-6-12]